MKQQISNIDKLSLIKKVLGNKKSKLFKSLETISARENINEGSLEDLFHAELKDAGSMAEFKKISTFSDLVDNDLSLTKSLLTKSDELKISSVRDLALNYDAKKLASLFNANQIPKEYPGDKPKDKQAVFARELEAKIFKAEPTASVHRMLNQNTLIVKDKNLASGLTSFFNKNTEFNIRQESILTILNKEDALIDIPEEQRSQVAIQLKTLQRITAISPDSKAVEVLYNENMHSARQISDLSEGNFIQRYGTEMGEAEAKQVYRNALAVNNRNQQAIMTMRDAMTPTGVAMIDQSINQVRQADPLGKDGGVTISYETLFGSADYCECGHCNSIYSPSAYYVELLQYIRNNNLDPDNIHTGKLGYLGTPLEHLFARRPDLKCLELTCENAYTILPYIDLSNEVMESYIALNDNMLPAIPSHSIQVNIDVHNTDEDDESSTLLAQPQNIKKKAYCTLSEAVIPFSLPYNQPIDAIRIFLEEMKTSRYDVMKSYRPSIDGQVMIGETTATPSQRAIDMAKYEEERWDRALCAEQLLMTEQDYVVLTKEGFASKNWYDTYENTINIVSAYQTKVELKSLRDQYFHFQETTPLSDMEWVKKEFLPRTGFTYAELVDLLKTFFINPYQPVGEVKNMLELINVPYRTLQSKVDLTTKDPVKRFAKLIEFIHQTYYQQQLERSKNPDPCTGAIDMMKCLNKCDVETWVYYYFEKLGRMIVLESNEDLQFKYPGKLVQKTDKEKIVFKVSSSGEILDKNDSPLGIINSDMTVQWNVSLRFNDELTFYGVENDIIGKIKPYSTEKKELIWKVELYDKYSNQSAFEIRDTCDFSKVKLRHLDGTALEYPEWDKMHRFIRLWRRMGWTMNELDSAILGLNADKEEVMAYENVKPCEEKKDDKDCECKKLSRPTYLIGKIDSTLICQLAHIVKVNKELTLQIPTLLTFWSNMETRGEKSLYDKLFLKKNIRALDPVFEPDAMNEFLTDPTLKISEHISAIMAGINMKVDDILYLNSTLILTDQLNLENLTILYHHQVLSRFLGLKVKELIIAKTLLGDPFADAKQCHSFLEKWHKLEDSGLNVHELQYITTNIDNVDKPIAHSQKDILFLGKELHEGLRAIDKEHADIAGEDFTIDVLRSKLSLIYDGSLVEKIVGLVEGTTLYKTNAPAGISVDLTGLNKVTYVDDSGDSRISIKGILTASERTSYITLNAGNQDVLDALTRIESQIQLLFQETLSDLITITTDKDLMLQGDILDPIVITYTLPIKGMKVLEFFMPYLRNELKNQLIVNSISGEIDLVNFDTESLLRNILKDNGTSEPLLVVIKNIGKSSVPIAPGSFDGYLIPQKSDEYLFYVQANIDGTVGSIELNEHIINLVALPDPTNVYFSADGLGLPLKIKLEAGSVNTIKLTGFDADFKLLKWKTASTASSNIPENILVANHLAGNLDNHLRMSQKAAMVINALELNKDEVIYLQGNGIDFSNLDFNIISVPAFLRLCDYTSVRNALPKTNTTLIETFAWSKNAAIPSVLSEIIAKIVELTKWDEISIAEFISAEHFSVNTKDVLNNEVIFKKLINARIIQDKVNTNVGQMFELALPSKEATTNNKEDFDHFWQTSGKLQGIYKARYLQSEWEEVVKPLNDKLRTHQRNALIAYLLNQKALKDWGVQDADSLFEFFLIDVQMEACMETSRIRQAISSVQTFVQRIFLDLENPNIKNQDFDDRRKRWDWMNRYRVWEANRKVFCFPENWLRSELRDDKSPFYKELESELFQKDVNPSMVKEALQNYLYKLDEVADMKVVGLYIEKDENTNVPIKLHVFSKTRNAPYFFYYRNYDLISGNWTPWGKMEIEIPTINYEGQFWKNHPSYIQPNSGSYLIPIVWNKRLFIFFPEFYMKIKGSTAGTSTVSDLSTEPIDNIASEVYYDIKMSFSEFQNGIWTQKRTSETFVSKGSGNAEWKYYENLSGYDFRTSISSDNKIRIHFYHIGASAFLDEYDYFEFDGNQLYILENNFVSYIGASDTNNFHYSLETIKIRQEPSYYYNNNSKVLNPTGFFKHEFTSDLIKTISISELKDFFNFCNKNRESNANTDFGAFTTDLGESIFHELKKAYSIYNWELFFYLPIAIAEDLNKNQQFEEAMNWYHFVFHPFESGTDAKRFWKFLPFKHTDSSNYLENFFKLLQPNTPVTAIDEWRDNPFNPHIIARSRPSAYMKWVVMRYLDNILDWGDYLYRQDTLETVNNATQLYVLAGHILGKRPKQIPKRGKIKPQTYLHLINKLDAFSNAVVDLELVFPHSNQAIVSDTQYGEEIVYANIYGMASTNYFCIPNNPKLMGYWTTISERLYNIRHCLNIQGVFRKLSLFEPEIDPALLVAATAQGLSLSSVLSDMNAPVPNYRFQYMLSKAFELCNEVKSLGNTLLSTKEKKDGEILSKMRSRHEVSMNNLIMEIKKKQLEEAQQSLDNLYENRRSPVYRMKYYLQQIGEDINKIPDAGNDFTELADKVEAVLDESGLKLINLEKQEMDLAAWAARLSNAASIVETTAGLLTVIPDGYINAMPMGVGASTMAAGGSKLGPAMSTGAKVLGFIASELSFQSSNSSRKAGFTRQLQDRIQQANMAGREIKQIDKQIVAQKIRVQMSAIEINNHQKQIDNSIEVDEFLRNKYTNEQLYTWMEGQIKTLYYQSYKMAYDLAKKVEGLYRFERGLTSTNFIQFGYWNSAYDGLLSGEQLYNGLKQIEIAHQENRPHDYEITNKQVSLRKLDPEQLLNLRSKSSCEFSIPEELFDMDFPGQYKRRIKTVSFSIPCIAGPYTSISAKATLTEHSFRISKVASNPDNYPRLVAEDDDRFITLNVPINAVALSSAQNDGGVFELSFKDERYMPFEGAGLISKWKLELPSEFKQFDYNTISDVIMNISYTSCEGGQSLKEMAVTSLKTRIKDEEGYPQYALFDLKHDFAQEWYKANLSASPGDSIDIEIKNIVDRFPYLSKDKIINLKLNDGSIDNLELISNEPDIPTYMKVKVKDNSLSSQIIFEYNIKID